MSSQQSLPGTKEFGKPVAQIWTDETNFSSFPVLALPGITQHLSKKQVTTSNGLWPSSESESRVKTLPRPWRARSVLVPIEMVLEATKKPTSSFPPSGKAKRPSFTHSEVTAILFPKYHIRKEKNKQNKRITVF